MEVNYINYNKKKYPIRVGYRALKKVKEEIQAKDPNKKIEDNEVGQIEDNEPLLWHSLVSGHHAVHGNMDVPFKREDMEFILDESLTEFIKLVNDFTIEMEKNAPKQNRQQRRSGDKGK